jgi:preprotein translocase subunit YajC
MTPGEGIASGGNFAAAITRGFTQLHSGLRWLYSAHTQGRHGRWPILKEFFMLVTPAYAQAAGGGAEIVMSVLPFILIFVIMYFLIIRPQRQQMKKREEMLKNVRRGDQVVTGGGIVGRVTKVVDDTEVEVEIAEGTRVRVARNLLADVRVKGEPVKE